MSANSESQAQGRIDKLETEGQLEAGDASALRGAYASPAESPAAETARRQSPPQAARFLQGELSEEAFRRAGRRAATTMGVLFGLLMGLASALGLTWGAPWWAMLATFAFSGLLQGGFFGLVMYLWIVRPAVEKQVALRQAAGDLAPISGVDAGQCPACRCEEFKVWTWRHPAMLHWILNPGLVVNEIVLGQRMPSSFKFCQGCGAQSVDCHKCHRAIDGSTWSGKAAFGHWAGLHCPHCDARLPMLSNALAWVVRLPIILACRLAGVR